MSQAVNSGTVYFKERVAVARSPEVFVLVDNQTAPIEASNVSDQ